MPTSFDSSETIHFYKLLYGNSTQLRKKSGKNSLIWDSGIPTLHSQANVKTDKLNFSWTLVYSTPNFLGMDCSVGAWSSCEEEDTPAKMLPYVSSKFPCKCISFHLHRCRRTISMETGFQNLQLCSTILNVTFPPEVIGPLFFFPLLYMIFQIAEGIIIIAVFRCYLRFKPPKGKYPSLSKFIFTSQEPASRRDFLDKAFHSEVTSDKTIHKRF